MTHRGGLFAAAGRRAGHHPRWRLPTKSALIRNSRLVLAALALLWLLFGALSGPSTATIAETDAAAAAAAVAKAKAAAKGSGSARTIGAKGTHGVARSGSSKPGGAALGGGGSRGGGSSSGSGKNGVKAPSRPEGGAGGNKGGVRAPVPTLRPSNGGGKSGGSKAPGRSARGTPQSSITTSNRHESSSQAKAHASLSLPAAASGNNNNDNDNDNGNVDGDGDGDGDDEVNARGAGKARLSNAVCNSTKNPRPNLDGLPLVMPFSRGIMGKRGKLRKDDLFIHRGNYAKNRLQETVHDPSLLPESAEAIWSAYPFRRCALVGNSGSLTGKALGSAIDEHDVVMRLNQAPTKGYAPAVGKKTTFRLLNSLWTGLYATVPTSAATLRADGSLDAREGARLGEAKALPLERNATLVVTRAEAESYARLRDAAGKLRPDVKLLMLAPRIVTAAKWLMREYRIRLCEAGYGPFPGGNTPSSGLVAAYILVQTCDRLNLFGFGGNGEDVAGVGGPGGTTSSKYHYYSGVGHRNVGTAVHSWGAELELLAAMARDSLVTLCTSREQEECVDAAAPPRVPPRGDQRDITKEAEKVGQEEVVEGEAEGEAEEDGTAVDAEVATEEEVPEAGVHGAGAGADVAEEEQAETETEAED